MDKESIRAFIEYQSKTMDKDWVTIPMVANCFIFYIGVYISDRKIISGIICTGINIGMVALYFILMKRFPLNQKNLHLMTGVFLTEFTISCGFMSIQFLTKVWPHPFFISLIYIFGVLLVSLSVLFSTIIGIKKGSYLQKKFSYGPSTILIMALIGTGMSIYYAFKDSLPKEHYYLLLGILSGIFGMLICVCIIYIIKYYYFKVLERMESNKEMENR